MMKYAPLEFDTGYSDGFGDDCDGVPPIAEMDLVLKTIPILPSVRREELDSKILEPI